jgi:hypothetical protein
MLAVTVLTVLPWTIRNYRLLGGFVPVSTIGWMAAGEGNMLDPDDWLHPNRKMLMGFRTSHGRIPDEIDRMKYARGVALSLIRKEQPAWVLKKFVRTSAMLMSPDSFLFKKISRGTYASMQPATIRALLLLGALGYLAVAIAGALGIASAPGHSRKLLPCLVVGSVFLVHLAANASSRYRLPMMLMLIPYAGYAITHWRGIRSRLSGRKWTVLTAILLWFLGIGVVYFFNDAVSLWEHGTYVSRWRP